MRHRLYRRIYFALVGVVLVSVLIALFAARLIFSGPTGTPPQPHDALLAVVAARLPLADAPVAEQRAAVADLARELSVDLALRDAEGNLLVESGQELPEPDPEDGATSWARDRWRLARWAHLPDGRWLGLGAMPEGGPDFAHVGIVAVLLGAMAVGCYKVARLITRPLERLQGGVERWGKGDLSTRAEVHGRDEVAELAQAFNRAAERVQALIDQQKRLLASASHELRSPLARLQMALELVADASESVSLPPSGSAGEPQNAPLADLFENARLDIAELDGLIGDLLLASRLEAKAPLRSEPVDLRALLDEEAERVGASVQGEHLRLEGEAAALRRMLRNLLENARRYSATIEARLERANGNIRVIVDDAGPGVPESEWERIFEPFYRREGHREGRDGGVGLGLALVRTIAEAHGGRAFCTARPGGGGRFVVELRPANGPTSTP